MGKMEKWNDEGVLYTLVGENWEIQLFKMLIVSPNTYCNILFHKNYT